MTKNEEIIRASAANLRLEGMEVTEEEKQMALDCLEGKISFSDAIKIIQDRYQK